IAGSEAPLGGSPRPAPRTRRIAPFGVLLGTVPELPDVTVYIEALTSRLVGQRLLRVRIPAPFLLRTVVPSVSAVEGRQVVGLRRIGKRIVIALEGELFLVIHLMIAGRFRWLPKGARVPRKLGLAAFELSSG